MDTSSSDIYSVVERLTRALRELSQVIAVVLAGSRAARTDDQESGFDLYVYALRDVPVEFRRGLLGAGAEIDHRFCESGDEWTEPSKGIHIDIMYRSPEWVENQTTSFWSGRKRLSATQPVFCVTSTSPKCSLIREAGTASSRAAYAFRILRDCGARW